MNPVSVNDRLGVFTIGLIALVAGAFGVVWYLDIFSWLNQENQVSWVRTVVEEPWLPIVALILGAILVVMGLRNMFRRVRYERMGNVRLDGSATSGRLTADPANVARVAATELVDAMGVASAKGSAIRFRGMSLVDLKVVAEPSASLTMLQESARETSHNVSLVLGDNAKVRTVIDVKTTGSEPTSRVL